MVERAGAQAPLLRFRLLTTFVARLRGLLGTTDQAGPVALARCSSVHTFGMRYHIDVALVRSDGVVLGSWRSVPPRRLLSRRHSVVALERPHQRGPWPAVGERVSMWGMDVREGEHDGN